MHTFEINVLFRFLESSTCFEHQEDHVYMKFLWYVFHAFM
jgi:hypothetical protein